MNYERQPLLNIGLLGCVSEGKSTAVYKLTKTKTQKHSKELEKNITIKPGYANLKIFLDENNKLTLDKTNNCSHHLSFIDCPGHHQLIQTMLGNINLMNGIIVVISVDTKLNKKPQLKEHLLAAKLANIDNIIILLNKLDLVKKEKVISFKEDLDNFLKKLDIKPKNIIPVCLSRDLGIDFILENIIKYFKPNDKNLKDTPRFTISRSFDINKSNCNFFDLNGGIVGGSLLQGTLKIGDNIEIKPGIIKDNIAIPLKSKIISLKSDSDSLDYIYPGGLIGIGTTIDPYYCKNDNLTGHLVGIEGSLPDNFLQIEIKLVATNNELIQNWNPKINEIVNLQISTRLVKGKIINNKKTQIVFKLDTIICLDYGTNILLTQNSQIIGFGEFIKSKNNILN